MPEKSFRGTVTGHSWKTTSGHWSFIKRSRKRHRRAIPVGRGTVRSVEEDRMIVQSACRAPLSRVPVSKSLRRPNCPRCGNTLFVAEESRFDVSGRIDHDWSCDDCGKSFVTSVRVCR
jgi:ribosomal protein S27AE